ncbi:MAG: hypothetical protein OEY14_18495, partial [Myxococcales bacterium]|nr:hypothetical protein [Myxococcales bacterium]
PCLCLPLLLLAASAGGGCASEAEGAIAGEDGSAATDALAEASIAEREGLEPQEEGIEIRASAEAELQAPFLRAEPAPAWPPEAAFFGEPDEERRRSLSGSEIARIRRGGGGRSLGFKITLEDGTEGYFKPEQSFSAAHWYSEIAAYHLDRALGFGRVPPVVGRRIRWDRLRAVAGDDPRSAEVRVRGGHARGAFIYWIPGGLEALPLGRGWERWIRIDEGLEITPYQRPADLRHALSGRPSPNALPRHRADTPHREERPAELSDLIVFDYLTQNVDRWGGGNVNVRTRGARGPLVYLDNGAGFWHGEQRLGLMERRLEALQRFRRRTLRALERFAIEDFTERLEGEPLAPILTARQLAGVEARRQAVLAHIASLRSRYGDAAVLPWD